MQKTATFFAPLRKVEEADDGSIMVTGIASTETRDSIGEVILASAIKKALPAYKRFPAIREMHRSTSAAGRAVEISVDDDGVTHLTAHIVDSDAVKKVKTKVYGGFSVGGKVLARDPDDKSIITAISLAEISLVDRPAHPEAAITMWKLDAGVGGDDDLIKIIGERDSLAKQLADRDRSITELAGGIERTTAKVLSIVAENSRLKTENADLTKRLAQLHPRVIVDNSSAARTEQLVGQAEKQLAELARQITELDCQFRQAGI